MTTYYVRQSGNDTNNGQSPASAWLTITKAANTVAAGDTVYVGAGIYREMVTMITAGQSGNPINFTADVKGWQTGDAGLVIISAFDDDDAAAARSACWDPAQKDFIIVRGFVFLGGSNAPVYNNGTGNTAYEGCQFWDCVFMASKSDGQGSYLNLNAAATPTSDGLLIARCLFSGCIGLELHYDENATAAVDLKASIHSSLFLIGTGLGASRGIAHTRDTDSTYGVGGLTIRGNTIYGAQSGIFCQNLDCPSAPLVVQNNLIARANRGLDASFATTGSVQEDYNRFFGCNNATYGTYTSGGHSDSAFALLLGASGDLPLWRFLGWSPFKPWEPLALADASFQSAVIDSASADYSPASDLYGLPRPMRRGHDAGAVEARARPIAEESQVKASGLALRFEGAGVHDFLRPVPNLPTAVSVWARYDSNYSGTLPQLQVLDVPGVGDLTATMTAAANTWQKLSLPFTPTSKAIVRIRLRSNDTSANGLCYFDELEVT